jgi:hypothetical protein
VTAGYQEWFVTETGLNCFSDGDGALNPSGIPAIQSVFSKIDK